MDYELIEISKGQWAYRVGGIYQEFDPDEEGFVKMSKQRAETLALEVLNRITQ